MKTQAPPEGRSYVLKEEARVHGFDAWTVGIQEELESLKPKPLCKIPIGHATVEVRPTASTFWLIGRWNGAVVGFRPAYSPGGRLSLKSWTANGSEGRFEVDTEIGLFRVEVSAPENDLALMRVRTTFTPNANVRFPYWPRDVYPLNEEGDPMSTRGVVHAIQRGTCAAVMYVTLTQPAEATFFYFHNLTWVNGFAQTTETELKGVIGDSWPDLGYKPPCSEERAMTAGEEEEWSDFLVRFCEEIPKDEGHRSRIFLDSLADVYRHLPPPDTTYRDWPARAEETLESLQSPKCWCEQEGKEFLRPYVNAEHPDSMVQTVLLPPLMAYADWAGKHIDLVRRLRRQVPLFYDEKSKAYRRYLESSAPEKNLNEADSWYLYHPLTNLAWLSLRDGDEEARELLRKGASFGVKVARHFNYDWPIKFDLMSLEPTTEVRKPGQPGESDVPGLYAYLMLQCRDIFGDHWYFEEALRALQSLHGLGFEIGYQFNNVAWGAVACARVWRETGEDFYLGMSQAFWASFFHNTTIWEPDYGLTRSYSSFMAVKCLHDADYSAMFEEYESFSAAYEYMDICGDELHPSLAILLPEYTKFLLSRGWYYYPSELPPEVLAKEVRNGEIDRNLAIPLEDLYAERCPPGSVGQEVYGAGAAFDFVTRAYCRVEGAPFLIFCEYPLTDVSSKRDTINLRIRGDRRMSCRLRLIPLEDAAFPPVQLQVEGKKKPLKAEPMDGHMEYRLNGSAQVTISWGRNLRDKR